MNTKRDSTKSSHRPAEDPRITAAPANPRITAAPANPRITAAPKRKNLISLLSGIALVGIAAFLIIEPSSSQSQDLTGGGAAVGSKHSANPAAVKAPAPAKTPAQQFLTLNPGDTIDLSPGPVSFAGHPKLIERIGVSWKFRARISGHTVLTVGAGRTKRQVYFFVSPMASLHVTRTDIDWYRSQYATGGIANCGPADVSMAILWARGKDVPVQQIRSEIGFPYEDGSLSFRELAGALDRHGVKYRVSAVSAPKDVERILNRGHLALVLIQTGGIDRVEGDPTDDLVGRYYEDDQGHYILIKGYSLDGKYFIVYDPYPVDWEQNSMRYGDDVSMIGKNRYYPARQILATLKTQTIIEVLAD